jgi:hypothetical protein
MGVLFEVGGRNGSPDKYLLSCEQHVTKTIEQTQVEQQVFVYIVFLKICTVHVVIHDNNLSLKIY